LEPNFFAHFVVKVSVEKKVQNERGV